MNNKIAHRKSNKDFDLSVHNIIIQMFGTPGFKESKSRSTLRYYIAKANKLISFCLIENIHLIEDFQYQDYENYISYLISKNLKPVTINGELTFLLQLLKFSSAQYDIHFDFISNARKLTVEGKGLIQRLNSSFTTDEIKRILHYATTRSSTATGMRNMVMLLILFDTGMRLSELQSVMIENIEFNYGVIEY